MRAAFFIAATLIGCLATLAMRAPAQQPDPTPTPPAPTLPTARDGEYAANLLYTIQLIEQGYVRPVSRADLLTAALSGLYEAAGETFPASVQDEAKKAKKDDDARALLDRTRRRPEIAKRLNDSGAFLASCRAMCATLDPYCEAYEDDGITCRLPAGRLDNSGVGIDLEDNGGSGAVRIMEVHPGGPAQKAGLRPGDRITAINSEQIGKVSSAEVMWQLNGGPARASPTPDLDIPIQVGHRQTIDVERDGQSKQRRLILEAKEFRAETVYGVQRHDDNSWSYWIDKEKGIAQVRIGPIMKDTADELRAVLSHLQSAGMRGLLLDLRWCPGGLLIEAVHMAELFLGERRIYTVKGRAVDAQVEMDGRKPADHPDLPLLVLVNDQTSGGGELIAAALQDHKRASIVGQRTKGKASIQIVQMLPHPRMHLKMTNALFIRPSGKNLNRFPDSSSKDDWGVRPNAGLEFRVSANLNRQLREWWLLQTLRPGPAREVLPLDNPSADPQRQFALQALRERIK